MQCYLIYELIENDGTFDFLWTRIYDLNSLHQVDNLILELTVYKNIDHLQNQ